MDTWESLEGCGPASLAYAEEQLRDCISNKVETKGQTSHSDLYLYYIACVRTYTHTHKHAYTPYTLVFPSAITDLQV